MCEVFQQSEAWGDLVVPGVRRGTYRLLEVEDGALHELAALRAEVALLRADLARLTAAAKSAAGASGLRVQWAGRRLRAEAGAQHLGPQSACLPGAAAQPSAWHSLNDSRPGQCCGASLVRPFP